MRKEKGTGSKISGFTGSPFNDQKNGKVISFFEHFKPHLAMSLRQDCFAYKTHDKVPFVFCPLIAENNMLLAIEHRSSEYKCCDLTTAHALDPPLLLPNCSRCGGGLRHRPPPRLDGPGLLRLHAQQQQQRRGDGPQVDRRRGVRDPQELLVSKDNERREPAPQKKPPKGNE